MKKLNLLGLSVVTIGLLVGCGSNGSSVATGTGFYVDNAVEGVDYVCGSKTGKTDSKGAFTFEEGKECKFTLAGIPLRTTKADELEDGKEVLEDNPKVAKFLQSIDANNDLSDGIQISDEVLTALTTALETSNSIGTLPEGTVLTEVVASVGHDVTAITGDVRTDEQVQEHLAQTQTEITKALLAGKTFYGIGVKLDGSVGSLEKDVVNATATVMTSSCIEGCEDNNEGTTNITIVGNSIVFGDGDKATLTKQTSDYLLFEDSYGKHYLYSSELKAKAFYDSLATSTPTISALSDLIVGKTYYIAADDSYTDENGNIVKNDHVETLAFGTDGKLYDTWVQNGEQKEVVMDYSVNGDTLSLVTPDNETVTFTNLEELSTHIRFTDASGKESGKFFFTYADAEATFGSSSSTINAALSDLIVGKTVYQHCKDGNNDRIYVLTFTTNGKIEIVDNGQTETIAYRIDGNTIYTTEDTGEVGHPLLEQTTDFIKFQDSDGETTFYFDRTKAEASVADNC